MGVTSLLRVGYVLIAVQGLVSAVAPKTALRVATAGWRVGFANVGDLEPRDWYLTATRAFGVGFLAAGLTGLILTESVETETGEADADDDPTGDGQALGVDS